MCNNNKNSYYKDPIGGTVFIRKDYYDKFASTHCIKYFAFSERYISGDGYADKTSLHFEIKDKQIIKEIPNDGGHGTWDEATNPLCKNCPHANVVKFKQKKTTFTVPDWLKNIQKGYSVNNESNQICDE